MEFFSAKCPQCGGALQVPDNRDSVKCMYCGTDVLVREAINLASGDTKNFFVLAKAAEEAGNHAEAYAYFTKVLESDTHNSMAWAGKANSAGWQSNLIRSRLDEMLACYEKALGTAANDGMKEVVKLEAAASIFLVAKAFFDMSTEHAMEFVGVPSAKYEHIDRCKDIIRACEMAYVYDPDLDEIANFIVDICNRITRLTGLIADDKSYFESVRSRHISNVTSPQIASAAKTNSDCFVVAATMGNEQSGVVLLLRDFRDRVMRKSLVGRIFIDWYYRNGPIYASMIRDSLVKRTLSFLLIILPSAIAAGIYLLIVGNRGNRR
jgi:tetratricopeptide (TPR) repeat protein